MEDGYVFEDVSLIGLFDTLFQIPQNSPHLKIKPIIQVHPLNLKLLRRIGPIESRTQHHRLISINMRTNLGLVPNNLPQHRLQFRNSRTTTNKFNIIDIFRSEIVVEEESFYWGC